MSLPPRPVSLVAVCYLFQPTASCPFVLLLPFVFLPSVRQELIKMRGHPLEARLAVRGPQLNIIKGRVNMCKQTRANPGSLIFEASANGEDKQRLSFLDSRPDRS